MAAPTPGRRCRARGADLASAFDLGDSPLTAIALAVGAVLLVVALVLFGWPLLLALLDLLVFVVLVVAGVVARVLFRRPWLIEAESDDGERVEHRVVGWRASGQRRRDVARELAHGRQ